ncbi:hypothetical protein SKAU_G00243260 [Synaphobranchus kaupii]|uniref:Trans-1,2-dihydrobenzene-1,2-diol dehydrogenase n=1 Tax=Synaphobranchus kaupii TaxID=118154 RepID=A0A9Q1F852_SYNKA|nr:hypothetical protein SKAU_G00243260 [Synaphobranchus kaupii]
MPSIQTLKPRVEAEGRWTIVLLSNKGAWPCSTPIKALNIPRKAKTKLNHASQLFPLLRSPIAIIFTAPQSPYICCYCPRISISQDVIYVGTIHPLHLTVGKLFMNAGKNIVCGKPKAVSSRDVQRLTATARKNDIFPLEVQRSARLRKHTCCYQIPGI